MDGILPMYSFTGIIALRIIIKLLGYGTKNKFLEKILYNCVETGEKKNI